MTGPAAPEAPAPAGGGTPPDPVPTAPGGRLRPLTVVLIALAAGLLAVAVVVKQRDDPSSASPTAAVAERLGLAGTVLDPGWERPDFTLTTTDGRPYDFRAETAGRLTLLFFGYTSCPDVCPIHLATLTGALDTPGMPDPLVVFVGVDAARDTPERVRAYLDQWSTDYVGLVGTPEELAAAQEAAQVAVAVIEPAKDDGSYLVGHASQILAYTPDDRAHVAYPFGVRRQDWVHDLPKLTAIDWTDVGG